MTEQAALRAAIFADPDDDTARLAYADWLDENRPDRTPSPAMGASARAEFIRVQCRLATGAFSHPDYPELLEREADLAAWLNTHNPDKAPDLGGLFYNSEFESGEWGSYHRGFLEVMEFNVYGDDAASNIEAVTLSLEEAFSRCAGRTLRMQDALEEEIELLVRHHTFRQLRGLYLDDLGEGNEDDAVAAIAGSPNSKGLQRLYLDFEIGEDGIRALTRSRHLTGLESLVLEYPPNISGAARLTRAIRALGRTKWFRNLRRLHLWLRKGDTLAALSELPPMPRLTSLTLRGAVDASPSVLRRFSECDAFPNLAHLDLSGTRLTAEHIELLAQGRWPLRHLQLGYNEIRKAGAEAIGGAVFASTLRILDLRGCSISGGGVQALAESEALTSLQHLDLAENPIGPGGLEALAASARFHRLRALDLSWSNSSRGTITARDTASFLGNLDLPRLRHLLLDQLPVGVRGAKAIASRATFANLTRLSLVGCSLGEAGIKAIVGSKTLKNLVTLDLFENKIGNSAAKLANRNQFPRLAACRLGSGVPRLMATRLRRRPGVSV